MKKAEQGKPPMTVLCLDAEKRLCPKFDAVGIAKFRTANEEMGVRVLDNCAEEHIM